MKAAILLGLPVHCMIREFLSDVHDARVEEVGRLDDFRAVFPAGPDFYEDELPLDERARDGILFDFYDVDELFELLYALFDAVAVVVDRGGYARILAAAYGADIEGFYIEAPAAEHSGDPCEDAELIFHECRYGVFHMIAKT